MNNLEKRIEKLEMSTHRDEGREILITHRNGNVARFCLGDGPPWKTIIIHAPGMNEEECKRFDENLRDLLEGKRR